MPFARRMCAGWPRVWPCRALVGGAQYGLAHALAREGFFRTTFLTINEGYLLNNFLPLRLGELGRAFLLSRKSDLTFMEILPTIVIERIIDVAFSAIILLSAIPFVVGASDTAKKTAFIAGGLVVLAWWACTAGAQSRMGAGHFRQGEPALAARAAPGRECAPVVP